MPYGFAVVSRHRRSQRRRSNRMDVNVSGGVGILLVILIVLGIIYFAKRV